MPVLFPGWKRSIAPAFIIIAAALVVVSIVGIPLCSKYVWLPLHDLSSTQYMQQCEGNAPILAEFNSFFVKSFHVRQRIKSGLDDSLHKIYIYLANRVCNDLKVSTTTCIFNDTFPPPNHPVYMLENSVISLHACASTEVSDNPVLFYIIETVENYIDFNPRHPPSKGYQKRISVGKNGVSIPTKYMVPLSQSDYYTLKFEKPKDVTLTYNVSLEVRQIDTDAENTTLLGVIGRTNHNQTVGTTIKLGYGDYCLFADIQGSSHTTTRNYTTLETHLEPRVDAGVSITVLFLLVFFFIILFTEVSIYFAVKKFLYHRKRREYNPMISY